MDSARLARGFRLRWLVLALICFGCGSGDHGSDRNNRDGGEDVMDASADAGGQGGSGGSGGGSGGSAGDEKDAGPCREDGACDDAGPSCGDSTVDPGLGEECDDGNADSLDGCSASCEVETNYACLTPGEQCITTVVCGDGFTTGNELCDDRNADSGDGCSGDCRTIEPGWACAMAGVACQAASCGDGLIRGFEVCDDGNSSSGDGCSADCQLERGYACPTAGSDCVHIVCGDDMTQGLEQCDYSDIDARGDCSVDCQFEPQCTDGTCDERCGDGLKLESEACDDGNHRDGDGCSSSCRVERGFTCDITVENPVLPIVYRDFIGTSATGSATAFGGNTGPLHQDFERYNSCTAEEVKLVLDSDGKPEIENLNTCVTSVDSFAQWYRSDATINRTLVDQLTFDAIGPPDQSRFQFSSTAFFPLDRNDDVMDGLGFTDPAAPGGRKEVKRHVASGTACSAALPAGDHNFHFTSEVRYWFTYRGGETLTFFGDDDVWVFINGHLAVDIAGVHCRQERSIVLPGPNNDPAGDFSDTNAAGDAAALDIHLGGTYEVVVFQAERHTSMSQYQLTLEHFLSARSVCTPVCGDGVVTRDEVCDQGSRNSNTAYGRCRTNCTWGARCGDGVVQSDEEACDDGINQTPYGTSGCAPGCKTPPYCGDGNVDSLFAEACDDVDNDGGYGECAPGCVLGERCGDGEIQADQDEQCDDGNRRNGDGCNAYCRNEAPD